MWNLGGGVLKSDKPVEILMKRMEKVICADSWAVKMHFRNCSPYLLSWFFNITSAPFQNHQVMPIVPASSACTATWDCAVHTSWEQQSVHWIKSQFTKSLQWGSAKRNSKTACPDIGLQKGTRCLVGRINTVSLGIFFSPSPSPTSSDCTAAWDWGLASSLQRCFQ